MKAVEVLKENVVSICPVCFRRIKSKIITEDSSVFMLKNCNKHGKFKSLVEKNKSFYDACQEELFTKLRACRLDLPISHRCNMNCRFCYFPKRNDKELSFDKISTLIDCFKGDWVSFSGGEPTLREDLPDLVRMVVSKKKIPTLTTNGLKLAEKEYVQILKRAGLRIVHFSLGGWFDENEFTKKKQKEFREFKEKALYNLYKNNMLITLSFLLKRGINEKYLKDVIILSLYMSSYLFELRIRSANLIGKYDKTLVYPTSEILELLCKIIGEKKSNLIRALAKKKGGKCICKLGVSLLFFHKSFGPLATVYDKFESDLPFFSKNLGSLKPLYLGFDLKAYTGDPTIRVFLSKHSPAVITFLYCFDKIFRFRALRLLFSAVRNKSFKLPLRYLPFIILRYRKLGVLDVGIRSWPNKNNVDFEDVTNCPSFGLSEDEKKILPFCYRFFSNE